MKSTPLGFAASAALRCAACLFCRMVRARKREHSKVRSGGEKKSKTEDGQEEEAERKRRPRSKEHARIVASDRSDPAAFDRKNNYPFI